MDDLISRQSAIDALSCKNPTEIYIYYDDAVKAIKELPSAQPERKTGRWINEINRWLDPDIDNELALEKIRAIIYEMENKR